MRARRLGQGGFARGSCAGRVVKNVAGGILARVKKCGGFYNGVAVWLAVCAHAGLIMAWRIWVFVAWIKNKILKFRRFVFL